jgi:hypothetical protein
MSACSALLMPRQPFRLLSDREEISATYSCQSIAVLAPGLVGVPRRGGEIRASAFIGDVEQAISVKIDDTSQIPDWLIPNLKRSVRLLFLPANWDLDGGKTIERRSINAAINALFEVMHENSSTPQWLPTSEGGVQLEWHEGGVDLEIEFSPDGSDGSIVFSDLREPGRDWHGPLQNNLHRLLPVFAERLQRTE